jgi:predicted ATPase
MPLTSLRLQHFKCYADSGVIPLAPLTVIFGKNNSGKSSILQSLLLMRQTLDAPEHGARLNLRGPLYPAGNYADIVHQHASHHRINMQFGFSHGGLEFEFSAGEPQPPRMTRLKISAPEVDSLEFRTTPGAGGPYEMLIANQSMGKQEDANFFFPAQRFFPLIGNEPRKAGRPNDRRRATRELAGSIMADFAHTLLNLKMVGPFRRQPERRYEYEGPIPARVDVAGEYVVNALLEDLTRRRRRGELIRAVNRWLKVVGRVRLMSFHRISKSARIFEIRLKDTDSGRWANFADVGFGIGQALPVFVEGLRTPDGGLFMVQEPEIHLHPDAQLRMADFLISLVRSGKHVIAETHSEALLLRIRRSIVSKKSGKATHGLTPDQVSIIYVDKRTDGTSHTKPLVVDELGQVSDWPAGFMDEATKERMAILQQMADAEVTP